MWNGCLPLTSRTDSTMYSLEAVEVRDNGFLRLFKLKVGFPIRINHHYGAAKSQVRILFSHVPDGIHHPKFSFPTKTFFALFSPYSSTLQALGKQQSLPSFQKICKSLSRMTAPSPWLRSIATIKTKWLRHRPPYLRAFGHRLDEKAISILKLRLFTIASQIPAPDLKRCARS